MTQSELEELSRRAAGCLPKDFGVGPFAFEPEREDEIPDGALWLHESTEACTEIMVRVLWKWGCVVNGDDNTAEGGAPDHAAWVWGSQWPYMEAQTEYSCSDPMLAYRVAVLRALCALKEGK